MAAYDLEEQEQIDEIKAWWKQYGNRLVNVLLVVSLVVIAWQGWNLYQRRQTAQASAVFAVLEQAIENRDAQRVKAASGELLEKFGGTSYASLGAISAAKALIDSGDAQTAKAQLLWAAEHAKDELRQIARMRAAMLLLDEKAYDEALKQLEGSTLPSFEARFADLRGDVLAAQDKKSEAIAAYRDALAKLAAPGGQVEAAWQVQSAQLYRELVTQKIDALGGGR